MVKKLIITITLFFIVFTTTLYLSANDDKPQYWYNVGEFREGTYYRTFNRWLNDYEIVDTEELTFTLDNSIDINPNITFNLENDSLIADIQKNKDLKVIISVEKTGLYELGFNFKPQNQFTNPPRVKVLINNEEQFNEILDLSLEVYWVLEQRLEENRYNRYGNELLPYSVSLNNWYKFYLRDYNSRYLDPYKVLLTEGDNFITITADSNLQIENFFVNNTKPLLTYSQYLNNYQNIPIINNQITLEAELFNYKNDIEIKPGYYKSINVNPASFKSNVLNILDGRSNSRGGTKVTYDFHVEESGLYNITFKYLQNNLSGLSAAKTIYIDGEIPYQDLAIYQFPESRNWTNHTLNDNGNSLYIYLAKGNHTLSLETTLAHYNDYIEELYSIMDSINSLGLLITSITGGSRNVHTNWNILKYVPSIVEDLNGYADRIDAVYQSINAMNSYSKEASEISTLKIASKQLRRLARRPNKIHLKLPELNIGSGSSYQLIGNSIGTLMDQPISFDTIYFTAGDVDIPKATKSLFQRIWFGLQSFFFSFFDERYKYKTTHNDDILHVWVAQSPLYLDIIQSMVDDDFTKKNNIEVKVNILPSSQKIILNNATNTNPDVILSIDSWEPYNYALRGLLVDLSKLPGFDDVTKNIYANSFAPVIFEDGVYAIPETQGMNILF